MIRAIAFDWGGIFTEGTFDSSAVRNLAVLGNTTSSVISATYFPLMEEFEAGALSFDAFVDAFLERSSLDVEPGLLRKTFLGSVRERTAMFAVLDAIPSSYRVGMLSNNVPVLCDRVRNDPRFGRIEQFVFSNEIGVRKPDPAAFEALTRALDVPPDETAFIDDNEGNIGAARALGFDGVLLDTFEGFLERWHRRLPGIPVDAAAS